ncbi:tail-specific protease, partial [Enterobacter hormaechei]|nr:tail-specific protease [Enterobacter hormaechei]
MKLNALCLLIGLVVSSSTALQAATPAAPAPLLRPVEAHALAAQASAELLSRFHYQNVPLDDAMSSRILDRYLKTLDPDRVYFMQSD